MHFAEVVNGDTEIRVAEHCSWLSRAKIDRLVLYPLSIESGPSKCLIYILSDKNIHIKIFNAADSRVFKVFKRKLVCCYIYNSRKHLHLASKLAFQGKQKQESMKKKTSLFIYQDIFL